MRAVNDPLLRRPVGAGLRLGKGLAVGRQAQVLHLTHVNKLARRSQARPDEVRVADLGQLVLLARRVEEFAVEGAAAAGEDSLL